MMNQTFLRKFFLCLLAPILFCTAYLSAIQNFENEIGQDVFEGRLYVQPSDVHIVEEGIFVNYQSSFFLINHVGTDSDGLYVEGFSKDCRTHIRCPRPECKKFYDPEFQSSKCPHNFR